MAVIGKGTNSLKKKDVQEQKGVALGFKKIRFAHKATAGDTGINLTSLVQPTEMSTYGFTNPSASTLAAAQLNIFRNNLKLTSSLRGLLVDQLSYVVSSSSQINFIDFTAEDGEIFTGWLDEAPTTSLSVVDGRQIIASGILLAGQTDFNIGSPIVINQNSAQQIGAVMVFVDRALQYRKVGNATAGDGDYIEVPVAGGLGSLIRFNASGSDRFITVISNGVVAERPDGSMMAAIERVQGQVDAMVPTLAAVAGVPETTFQTAPNDIDLKQFGDTVLGQQSEIDGLDTRITTLENEQIRWQRKDFSATSTPLTDIVGARFNSLTIGKTYRITIAHAVAASGAYNNTLSYFNGATNIVNSQVSESGGQTNENSKVTIFVATATGLTANFVRTGTSTSNFQVILEELNRHVATTQWT